jgi:predicted peptidase
MKRLCSFSFFFLIVSSIYSQKNAYKFATYEHDGQRLPYRILLPEGYDMQKKYPLLLFLHGAGERGSDNELQLTHGSDQFLTTKFRKEHPAIIVFPQCPKGAYWATILNREGPLKFSYAKRPKKNPTLDLVEGMLKELLSNYEIDKSRIYVGGLSMGGMGTFELVYRNPRLFAAAFAICGGANPKIARKIKRPVWRIDHGEVDSVVPIALSEQMFTALKKKKAQVNFNRYPEVNHNSWDNVFKDPSFLPWLFSQSK